MAAAQVAHFRSESTSPAPLSSTGGVNRQPNIMATAGPSSSATANNNANSSNNNENVSPNTQKINNAEGVTTLMLACQQGRHEDVLKILKKKPSAVKDKTRSGKVALHFCAESGNSSSIETILAADPFLINAQDEEGYSPLDLAVINGHKDIVRKLIGAGADLNCLDNERHSLVHWATVCGEVEILEILLSNGAPSSTPDIHLAHPIHYASQMCGSMNGVGSVSRASARVQSTVYGVSPKKGLQILKRLIQFGCPVDVRDQDGRQPLLWAASAGSGDAILLLVNAGGKVDAEDRDGLTALHCAASRGHTDCLETLIALCGAEVDIIDNNGCTALFYAVTLGHADCTELLLNYGAEPNRQDRKGRTPAHCGAAKGQLETLKLLGRHGGNLWLRNVRGDLPLHEAVLSRRKDLVMWLLSQRMESINTPNNDGRCPIHLAALNNNVEMVKILIDHRADLNLLMRSGKGTAMTPLDAAMHKGNSAVAKFLQLHGGLPSNSLNDAALHRRLNRSIEGQISPAQSSMRGSHLSHHHPSPDDQHRTFTSPEIFDSSLVQYKNGVTTGPFITSTPIMDDGSQTDSHYLRDMEVQVSDSFEETHGGGLRSNSKNSKHSKHDESSSSHRKSERRRHRRSNSHNSKNSKNEEGTSTSSSPERSNNSNQLTSQTGKKSSRRSKSNSKRNSEEKITDKDETDGKKGIKKSEMTTQESSEHDNTLMSEKFSELENVGVQSSETDVREEELGPVETEKSKHKPKDTKPKSRSKSKSKSPEKEKVDKDKERSRVKSKSVSKANSRDLSREKKSKSKSKTPLSPSRERSLSAKSTIDQKQKKDSQDRSRSASASADSRSSSKKAEIDGKDGRKSSMRTPSGKRSNVSWHDKDKDSTKRNRSKSGEDRERRSRSKSTGKGDKSRDRSKSAGHRRSKSTKTPDFLEEIEAGKKINLQEAARRRSESLASRDPSRSRSHSISQPRELPRNNAAKNPKNPKSVSKSPSRQPPLTSPSKKAPKTSTIKPPTASEEREIQLQEALLSSSSLRPKGTSEKGNGSSGPLKLKPLKKSNSTRYNPPRKSSEENDLNNSNSTLIDSGFSDNRGMTTSTDELNTRLSSRSHHISVKRRVVTKRGGSGKSINSDKRKSIFSSAPKQYRAQKVPKVPNRFDTLIVHQMSVGDAGFGLGLEPLEDEASTSTHGGSVTSEDPRESPRRRRTNYSRPRSKLTFSRNDNVRDTQSPSKKKNVDVDTEISVTQAMQASMRKYNLERMIFHELLELKRLQVRAGKANEQLLVKRIAENYKRAGYSVNFRDYDGPHTFRSFEKYLYDQLRLLQNNRRLLPRFGPSDDIEKLSTALKKMNSTKLPYLDDAERSESVCENIQCTHTTHRCHHAAHAYTGVPCAAYIGTRKNGFLPKVNPLKAPGPTQKDLNNRPALRNQSRANQMQISISPRTDTQSPITLEVQQGLSTQVFTLPTKALDPSKNYYVSLSIKPNPSSPLASPIPQDMSRPSPGDVVDDGSISAPPPPVDSGSDVPGVDRDKHNRSM